MKISCFAQNNITHQRSVNVALALFLILIFGYSTYEAQAHGGGVPQLVNAKAGPYRVFVWTQPDPLRVGEAHFTIAVSQPPDVGAAEGETGNPVLDATIQMQVEPINQTGETLTVLATHDTATNKLFYEADLELPTVGQWRVVVSVEGPDGSGNASFEIEVFPSSSFNWALLGGLALTLLATGWVLQKF